MNEYTLSFIVGLGFIVVSVGLFISMLVGGGA